MRGVRAREGVPIAALQIDVAYTSRVSRTAVHGMNRDCSSPDRAMRPGM